MVIDKTHLHYLNPNLDVVYLTRDAIITIHEFFLDNSSKLLRFKSTTAKGIRSIAIGTSGPLSGLCMRRHSSASPLDNLETTERVHEMFSDLQTVYLISTGHFPAGKIDLAFMADHLKQAITQSSNISHPCNPDREPRTWWIEL